MANFPLSDYKLCFIGRYHDAWFTTAPLHEQWGDDWDDRPYEYNAGDPYTWEPYREMPKYDLLCVKFDGILLTPAEQSGMNSRYSVRDINAGAVAWLYGVDATSITAGTTLPDFVTKLAQIDDTVYFSLQDIERLNISQEAINGKRK